MYGKQILTIEHKFIKILNTKDFTAIKFPVWKLVKYGSKFPDLHISLIRTNDVSYFEIKPTVQKNIK